MTFAKVSPSYWISVRNDAGRSRVANSGSTRIEPRLTDPANLLTTVPIDSKTTGIVFAPSDFASSPDGGPELEDGYNRQHADDSHRILLVT